MNLPHNDDRSYHYCWVHVKITPYNATQSTRLLPSIVEGGKLLDQMTPLESLPNRKRCLFVKKCLLQKMTDAFNQYFKTLHHNLNTRNNNIRLKIQPAKLEIFKTTFLFFFLVLLYITVYRVIFIR